MLTFACENSIKYIFVTLKTVPLPVTLGGTHYVVHVLSHVKVTSVSNISSNHVLRCIYVLASISKKRHCVQVVSINCFFLL